jgi:putative transposase
MRGPNPLTIVLPAAEAAALTALARGHTTPQQVALRARIVLAAAAGLANTTIARDLATDVGTVRRWRRRWHALATIPLTDLPVVARLADEPRPGVPPRITPPQVCAILALACEAPARSGRPISQWTAREIAAEVVARGIVDQISDRHAARLLKRGISNRTATARG